MMSDLFDTLITIVIVAGLILGARAYVNGDLALWLADNVPAAVALLPDGAPNAEVARQLAAQKAVDGAVDAVASVTDAMIPGAGDAVETVADWTLPSLPSAATVAGGVGDTISEAIEPEMVIDEKATTGLAAPPEPTAPKATGQKDNAQPIAPANQAKPVQPVVVTTYQRYTADAFRGLCGHVAAAGLSHARVTITYPDGMSQEVIVYPDRVVSRESRSACWVYPGFCLSADNGLIRGGWAWSDAQALVGMANLLSGYQAQSGPTTGGGAAGTGFH